MTGRMLVSLALAAMCACSGADRDETVTATTPAEPSSSPVVVEPPPTSTTATSPVTAPPPTVVLGPEFDALPFDCQPEQFAATVAASALVEPEAGAETAPLADAEAWEVAAAAVRDYGCAHLESYGGLWIDGEVVVAGFTGALTEHRAALLAVTAPDMVRVEQTDHRLATLQGIRNVLQAELDAAPTEFTILGQGRDRVAVTLRADQFERAASIYGRFGDAVEITLGALRWTPEGPVGEPVGWCDGEFPPLPRDAARPTVELVLDAALASGSDIRGVVRFTNSGDAEIVVETGEPATVTLFDSNGRAVGGFVGMVAGVGRILTLPAGATAEVLALGGTASCRAELGYVLPAGTYSARARIELGPRSFWSDPVPLTIG